MMSKISTSHYALTRLIGAVTLFLLLISAQLSAQISGTLTDAETGETLIGATVIIQGTSVGTVTDIDGRYEVMANPGDVLVFSFTGYTNQEITVGSETEINVMLSAGVLVEEVVVTGYATQRKRDITGAVAVVNAEDMNTYSAASFAQKLEGRASGLNIHTSGEPGEGSVVRIRGISSFQNNDPLYIIDGVPVQDAFNTGFNPNDIESIQVLKDAASASIYGARANNGVIIVTTKQGSKGAPRITYDAYVGVTGPAHNMDFMIKDPVDYSNYVWDRHENAGLDIDASSPYSVGRGQFPAYIFPFPGTVNEADYSFPDNIIIRTNPEGTDWFDEIFDPALVMEHNLGVSGGGENSSYYLSASYTDQNGAMIHNYFRRFSLRANSSFNLGPVTIGENISLSRSRRVGNDEAGGGNQDEQGIMSNLSRVHTLIPVFDVGGNAGGAKNSGMSGSNDVFGLMRNKDNIGTFYRILGNAFIEVDIIEGLRARSSFGIDFANNFQQGFNFPVYENRQPNTTNSFRESWQNIYNWTWTNTLTYNRVFAERHNFQILGGYESIKNSNRTLNGSIANYFTTDINAWYVNGGLADPD
ncbi:MAG: SusC/RagA family TonB-linked outer membrane protein, partial [Saprospiraceae bacterium]|nr:SusC/RagA family TonB-linked outer membrane protein [Saprospiraceae bacterium]